MYLIEEQESTRHTIPGIVDLNPALIQNRILFQASCTRRQFLTVGWRCKWVEVKGITRRPVRGGKSDTIQIGCLRWKAK
jgi:hypothetical protein